MEEQEEIALLDSPTNTQKQFQAKKKERHCLQITKLGNQLHAVQHRAWQQGVLAVAEAIQAKPSWTRVRHLFSSK
jgi:hypothetical protein